MRSIHQIESNFNNIYIYNMDDTFTVSMLSNGGLCMHITIGSKWDVGFKSDDAMLTTKG